MIPAGFYIGLLHFGESIWVPLSGNSPGPIPGSDVAINTRNLILVRQKRVPFGVGVVAPLMHSGCTFGFIMGSPWIWSVDNYTLDALWIRLGFALDVPLIWSGSS